ncbi:MAG: single-stranded DNA-binding protein [Burkholderiales bacterium]|nr:single-stranded DNA-binding protein [Anaerolineae bacterium]
MSFQQCIIVGNLGRDPELRYLQSGAAVCSFTIACNEVWNDRQTNEKKEKVTWFKVSVWGPQAETCNNYLSKGRQVMVIGTIDASAFAGQDGLPRASLELRARDVRFLSSGAGGSGQGDYDGGGQGEYGGAAPTAVDDIPF